MLRLASWDIIVCTCMLASNVNMFLPCTPRLGSWDMRQLSMALCGAAGMRLSLQHAWLAGFFQARTPQCRERVSKLELTGGGDWCL